MPSAIHKLQLEIANALNAMPDVFSTVQWGGRAYKLPGPGGSRKKPTLLAHIWLNESPPSVGISFKLPPDVAADLVEVHDFLAPHSFRTLAPAGWVTATIDTARNCRVLIKLLHQSRTIHPVSDISGSDHAGQRTAKGRHSSAASSASSPVARRIDAVMQAKKSEGWSLPDVDGFEVQRDRVKGKTKPRKA
ncbi:MAG TPA: MmcQ/YjbR family DNA-binding protein [Phycisphaerales bacterium]|nr:MmcQ/YjbR family DNA-binding protein [Phycisphaerales bacterium]